MVYVDQCGEGITGAGSATVERYDRAVRSLLLFADDVVDAWEATVTDDPGFVLGHVGRAYLRCLTSEGPDAADARAILGDLHDERHLTDRERRHLDAARAYADGDLHGASDRLEALTVEYPRDALALAVGHQLDFFRGDAAGLRDRPGRTLLSWDPSHPLFGFVLGMHAFGLEECNLHPQAEAAGLRALDAERRDVWALHAVVHVHEMQSRVDDGLRFMDERRSDWADGNFFVVHNAWHEALLRLAAGDIAGALAIYDTTLHHDAAENVALELLDAASLLWRLHLDGIDVGDRWHRLADAWSTTIDDPWYVFNDLHATMAFTGAGRLDDARELIERLERYAATPIDDGQAATRSNVAMTAQVGIPACAAIVAFGEGRDRDVIELLHPIRKRLHHIGGSNAQRDVLARTLLEASIRGGERALATALVSERLAVNERNPHDRRQLARLLDTDTSTNTFTATTEDHQGPTRPSSA